MHNYIDLLKDILANGIEKEDRTGIGSISVFGRLLRWDLSKGFPIITTRRVPLRIAFEETMFFLRGFTDTKILENKNINIWKGNTSREFLDSKGLHHLPEGDMGRGYGHVWRKWEYIGSAWMSTVDLVKLKTITGDNSPFKISIPLEHPDYTDADDFVGKTFTSNNDGEFLVLKRLPTKNGNSQYRVQFLTGINSVVVVSRPSIRTGQIKNPYGLTQAGGCYGPTIRKSAFLNQAYTLWRNMMERCHGNDLIKTANYKQRGVYVDSSWRCFNNFYFDIQKIIGFDNWVNNPTGFQLDKDYYGSNFYSKNTTIFLPRKYNEHILNNHNINGQLYIAEHKKTGEIFKFTSPYFFNKHTNTQGMVDRALLKQNGNTVNWKFTVEQPPPGYKWRQKFYIDQIKELLVGLRNEPFSRRHVVTGWNPGDLHATALPPCHMLHMYSVTPDKRLHSSFVMRSNDVPYGLPFNIMGYALLNEIFSKHLGLIPGELMYMGHDVHIYKNQISLVEEIIKRSPRDLPKLVIKKDLPTFDDILNLQWEDIELIGYDPHPDIKDKPGMAV